MQLNTIGFSVKNELFTISKIIEMEILKYLRGTSFPKFLTKILEGSDGA